MLPESAYASAISLLLGHPGAAALAFFALVPALAFLWRERRRGPPPEPPRGQTVVVTGASSGIGEQLAYLYAARGSRLVLLALEAGLLEQVRENCLTAGASSVAALAANLAEEEDYGRVRALLAPLERVDVLHLNHGMLENRLALDYERGRQWKHFSDVLKCNYESHVRILSLVLNALVANGDGAAVAVTCSGGIAGPLPFDGGYAAAKSALCSYFSNLRQEMKLLGCRVHVSVMFPGAVDTAFTRPHKGLRRYAVPAARLAERFVAAVANKEENVYCPANVRAAFWLHGLLPSLYNRVVSKWVYLPNRPDYLGRLNEMKETLRN